VRLALLVGAACLVALAAAGAAPTKDGARARLTTAVPLGAPSGRAIRVAWTVSTPDDNGGSRLFGASGMFVRLLSRTGADATTAFAAESAGRYSARARVPSGGIGGVRLGLRGTTDIFFPLENSPFGTPTGVTCDVGALHRTLVAFVDAFNRGDLRRLDRLFSRTGFVWYSSGAPGERLLPEAKRRVTLMDYFRARHRAGDRIELRGYRFNAYDRARSLGHFELRARRRAGDFEGGRRFGLVAKGALDCSRAPVTIAVLSLGSPSR
jgi:hypothetical protein